MDLQIVQAAFMLGFVTIAAGAFCFFMERGDLAQAAAIAAVIYVVADILNKVGLGQRADCVHGGDQRGHRFVELFSRRFVRKTEANGCLGNVGL